MHPKTTLFLLGALTTLCLLRLTGAVEASPVKANANDPASPKDENYTKNNATLSEKSTNSTEEGMELEVKDEMRDRFGATEVGNLTTEGEGRVTTEAAEMTTEALVVTTEEPVKEPSLLTWEQLQNITGPWSCDSPIYCRGPLLDAVQRSRIFPDSKTFVDMPMTEDPDVILQAYEDLLNKTGPLSKRQLKAFVNKYFLPAGKELEPWELPDWEESPKFMNNMSDPALKTWAGKLHGLWKTLGRRIKPSIPANSSRHSLLHVPNGFIVPGDRFREFYYWDTYWVIKGLLVSGLTNTTRGVIENLLHMVKEYGMVPNGGRVYFTNRSQPPLLASMVNAYYEATNDSAFLQDNFHLLEQEYNFWVSNRSVTVSKDGKDYIMARYNVNLAHPRAEGYLEDLETVRGLAPDENLTHFSHLASGAESGWDYSTRWFAWSGEDEYTLRSIKAANIVPVDLNTFLLQTEKYLSKFAGIIGESDKASRYADLAAVRTVAMEAVFWHQEDGVWYDYDLTTNSPRRRFFMSNVSPLLTKPDAERVEKVIDYLKNEGVLKYPGGVPTSTMASGQQWDFPNAWAPLIDILVTGLADSDSEMAQQLAFNISKTWLDTNYAAWAKTGHMYEKYMVRKLGAIGSGGEYKVQVGFGWTNGVILQLISRYGNDLEAPDVKVIYDQGQADKFQGHSAETKVTFVFIPVVLLVVAALFFICFMKRNIQHRASRTPKYTSATPFQKFDN